MTKTRLDQWMRPAGRRRRGICRAGVVLACSICAEAAMAQSTSHELLLFLSAEHTERPGLSEPLLERRESSPSADILYSYSANGFRLLGEYEVDDDERELERFQAGWQLSEATRVWFGRFHHSSSYWNTEHHHGQFLQTTILRPALEAFEDHNGILPAHTTGLLIESRQELEAGSGLSFSLSAGLSGRLGRDEIKPFDVLDPESDHKLGLDLRIAFSPEFLGDDEFGLIVSKHRMGIDSDRVLPPSWDPSSDEVALRRTGFYGDWNFAAWRLLGSVTRIGTLAHGGADSRSYHFTAGYVQAEYMPQERLIAYGRAENTTGDTNYLDLFPAYVRRQILLGAKWYLTSHQAVSFEIANAETTGDQFSRISVQWSAVFP
jgi:hypothetical protein